MTSRRLDHEKKNGKSGRGTIKAKRGTGRRANRTKSQGRCFRFFRDIKCSRSKAHLNRCADTIYTLVSLDLPNRISTTLRTTLANPFTRSGARGAAHLKDSMSSVQGSASLILAGCESVGTFDLTTTSAHMHPAKPVSD